jgi:hypothetical protein
MILHNKNIVYKNKYYDALPGPTTFLIFVVQKKGEACQIFLRFYFSSMTGRNIHLAYA